MGAVAGTKARKCYGAFLTLYRAKRASTPDHRSHPVTIKSCAQLVLTSGHFRQVRRGFFLGEREFSSCALGGDFLKTGRAGRVGAKST